MDMRRIEMYSREGNDESEGGFFIFFKKMIENFKDYDKNKIYNFSLFYSTTFLFSFFLHDVFEANKFDDLKHVI